MKKKKQLQWLFSSMLVLFLIGCSNDDETVEKNRAPESFQLTEENFTIMYNRDKETVNIDWPNVKDPDGDQVKYHLKIDDEQKASDLNNSEVELPSSAFTDLMSNHKFEVVVTDPKGLKSSASAERKPFPNEAPNELAKVSAKATFYGAELSWEAASDPDQNKVYYSIEIGGTIVAEGIESTSFIVRGYDEETTHKATVKAVDEFGAESQGKTVEFTTLKKETISSKTVTVNVWGVVVNEKGEVVKDATVRIEGQEQKTNERGWFLFNEISVSESRAMLTVTAPNYFKSFKTLKIANGKTHSQRIELLPKTIIGTVNAAEGGEVSSDEGMKVALPENAFGDYSGEVKVASRLMDPTDEDFGFQNPGLESYNAQGEYGTLQSFGMAAIEMQDANGNELQLKAGKQATLTFPVPEELGEFAPAVIPLWAFDEEQNIWVEEGQAELKNGVYIGKVGHFSLWNCDDFRQGRNVCFTVLDENDKPITNAYVEIILENGMVGNGFTDENGEVCTFMPTGTSFTINVSIGGAGTRQCNLITGQKGDGVPFGTTRVSRIIKAQGGQELYVSIEGTATSCNDAPLETGFVVIRDPQDNVILTGFTNEAGKFFLQGLHCFPFDGNESNRIEVIAYDFINNKYSKPQEFRVVSNHIISKEPFKACQDDIPPFGESGNKIYEGDLTFNNNQEVVEFISKGYTGIDGNLVILGGQVTDISAFKNRLLTVTGFIRIEKTGLTNLSALNSITDIGGALSIRINDELQSIGDGFSKIKEISSLRISENKSLQSIAGFNELEKAGAGTIIINSALQSISGFSKLEKAGDWIISQNHALQNITGFTNLKEIDQLGIYINDRLPIIDGFNALEKAGSLQITNNGGLKSITGFANLQGLFKTLDNNNNLDISTNLELESITGFQKMVSASSFRISENIKLTTITGFQNLTEVASFKIERFKGVDLNAFANIERAESLFKITEASNLETLPDFNKIKTTSEMTLSQLPKITKIPSFNSLETVKNLTIWANNSVKSINGFNNLTTVSGRLSIDRNNDVMKIDGFNKLQTVKELYIAGNNNLSDYCGIPKAFWNPNGSIQSFELKNNSYNPTQQELFNGTCKQ